MAGVEDEDEYKDACGAADPPPSSPSPTSKPKPAAAAMAGVEDEDEYKDACGAADPPPSSSSPTSKPKPAAATADGGGGGLGRTLFASIPLPASLSAAIGRFSSHKPPASNVGLGLLLDAGPATPAPDAASPTSSPHLPPLASLQRRHGEDQVDGLGAGVGEEWLGLVPAEERGRPTAEDREKEGVAVNRNDYSLRGLEEEGEQCQGDELGAAVYGCMIQDQEEVVEQEGATEDCAAVVELEDWSSNAAVEQYAGDETRAVKGDNAVEVYEKVTEQEDVVSILDAAGGGVAVGLQEATEYYTALEAVEQCTNDGSRAVKDDNVVEEKKKVVEQEVAVGTLDAAKDCATVESQKEEDVMVAEQSEGDMSVQDQHNVVEQCTDDHQRTTTADDNAAEDQEVVEQGVSVLGAAKVDIAVESQEDIVVVDQIEDEQCASDQLITSTESFAAEYQEASREKIGFSAGYTQRPGKLNCHFYMSNGSCSYGSSCHFNHPQLKAKLEVSNFSSEQRNCEAEFLKLNRVGLPIREGARKCTYYMRNGTCRYGKKCCFDHPEGVLDVQLMPTGWDDTKFQSSPHSKKSAEHATINDISSGSEILPPNILQMLLPPQNVPPCTEESEMKDPDWSSASGDSDSCCSADSSDGPLCKQEHVKHLERPECPFLRRFGNCKFASSCQYYHPKDKFPGRYHRNDKFPSRYHSKDNFQSRYGPRRVQPLADLKVYPERPGEPECPFYMKTGSCKFGSNCKFHHPKELTPSMQGPTSPKMSVLANEHHPAARIPSMQSPKRSVAANEHHPAARITLQDHMCWQQKCPERPGQPDCRYYMQFGKCKFQSACIFNHPKDILSSGWQPAECPFYKKSGTCQFGSACEFSHPKDWCSSRGEAIDDGTDYEHDFVKKSENVLQQQENTTYPERTGELECSHYLKHGYCKFQNSCKFHHPADRISRN
ncbi:unnamed protein product [Urochloa humidicola]